MGRTSKGIKIMRVWDNASDSVLPVRVANFCENHQRPDHAIHSSQRTRETINALDSQGSWHQYSACAFAYCSSLLFRAICRVV